jgi:hypothetical protein
MCWNAPVSLGTFLSSILMCMYIWHRNGNNDRPLAIWIAWFSLMQLFEFFMWRNMQEHTLVSKVSLISILLQPFSLAAGLYFMKAKTQDSWRKPVLLSVMLVSIIQAISASFYAFKSKTKWLSEKGPNCHLVWWFIKNEERLPLLARPNYIFQLNLLIAVLVIKPFRLALIYSFFGLSSFIITRLFYPGESGSLWCWVSNILAIATIAMPYIKL